jgi:spore coat polysaccharide biosynthesis predicted glycosyltransferase SpsG
MNHDIDPAHRTRQARQIANVADEIADPVVVVGETAAKLRLLELVAAENPNRLRLVLCEQDLDQLAAERPGAAGDENCLSVEVQTALTLAGTTAWGSRRRLETVVDNRVVTDPVLLVTDAGEKAGLGHLSRSAAIAVALRCRGTEMRAYAQGVDERVVRDGVEWLPLELSSLTSVAGMVVVIDSYRLPQEALAHIGEANRLVVMHDQGPVPEKARLVVSVTDAAANGQATLLRGLGYAALRPDFWGLPTRVLRPDVRRVVVTTGSGQFDDVANELARTVAAVLPGVGVAVVRGPHATADPPRGIEAIEAPNSLLEPLLAADLVISAGGQTMLEAVAVGTPCVALPLVENQRAQVALALRRGAVRVVDQPDADAVASAATALALDHGAREALSTAGQRAVDGYGALRVAFEIAKLMGGAT